MAVTDYLKKKNLEVTSQNDSGTTQDKAQPVLAKGETSYSLSDANFSQSKGVGSEDGIPKGIAWNNDGSKFYLVGNGSDTIYEYNVSTAFDISTASLNQGKNLSSEDDFIQGITWNNDGTKFYITGENTSSIYEYNVSTAFDIGTASFNQSKDVSSEDSDVVSARWNNDGSKLYIIGADNASIYQYNVSTAFDIGTASFNQSKDVGNQDLLPEGLAWGDNGTKLYVSGKNNTTVYQYNLPDDSTTGTGDIVLDWTNISSESDIAVYDQNGNLLDYEIESFDATAETAVLWCYNSWTRDDSVQAQIAYGDNSQNVDRQNVTGTWNNTGQNAVMVQHLNDDPLTATDSTANNNDGTVNGATSVTGQFDGGAGFDGTDDEIDVADDANIRIDSKSSFTVFHWFKSSTTATSSKHPVMKWDGSDGSYYTQVDDQNGGQARFRILGLGDVAKTGTDLTDGNWHLLVGVYDESASNELKLYIDGNLEDSISGTIDGSENATLGIGYWANQNDRYYEGDLDEVKIYNKAPSAENIQADYDASPKGGQVYFSQQAAEDTTQPVTLSGSASSTATATGTLQTNRLLSGTVTATSTDTGVLTTVDNRVLSGTATSTATANGTLTTVDNRVLSSTATSTADLTGSLINAKFLSSSFTSNASATCNLTTFDERILSGSASGTATATGNITTLTEATFSGTATGQVTANGLLTLVEPKVLSGTATAAATATGNLTAFDERILSSTATSTADLTGSLINANFLSGSLLSESTAAGSLTTFDERILNGSLSGQSTAAGTLQNLVSITLSGDAQGNTTISGALSDELTLSGTAGVEGNLSGVIAAQRSLQGLAEAEAEAQGDITLFVPEEKQYREFTPQKMATVGRQNALAFLNRIDDPNDRYNGDYIYRSMPRTKSQEFDGYPFIVLEGYTFNDIGDTKNGLLSQFDFDIEFHVYGLENSDDDIEAIDAILDQVNYMVKGKPQLKLAIGAELTRTQFIRQNRFTGVQQKDQPIVRYEVEVRGKLHLDMEALE